MTNTIILVGTVREVSELIKNSKTFFWFKLGSCRKNCETEDLLDVQYCVYGERKGSFKVGEKVRIFGEIDDRKVGRHDMKIPFIRAHECFTVTPETRDENYIDASFVLEEKKELHETAKGGSVINLKVSTVNYRKKSVRINAVAWNDVAENIERDMEYGDMAKISGSVQVRAYKREFPNGVVVDRHMTQVVIDRLTKV